MITTNRTIRSSLALVLAIGLAACGDETGPENGNGNGNGDGTVATVVITPVGPNLTAIGTTVQLTATALDARTNRILGKTFTWASAAENTATVNSSGVVTAVANGLATVTATVDGIDGTVQIMVNDAAVGAAMCTPIGAGPEWTFTRIGSGTKPALTVDAGGAAHVAFMNEEPGGWVRYARLPLGAPAPSTPETAANGYFYGPIDIVRGSDTEPRILYHDHDSLDQIVAIRSSAGNWSLEPMPSAGHDGWYGTGEFDLSGTLHTATYDPSGQNGRGMVYGAWTGFSWTIETAAAGSFDYKGGTAIVWTPNEVHFAFYDDVAGEPRLATRTAPGVWAVTTPEPLGGYADVGRFPDMALDPDGQTLHLLYLATTSATEGVVRYALGVPGNFQIRDVTPISGFTLGIIGARDIATMDLDLAARPIVATQSLSEMMLLRIDGANTDTLASFQAAAGVVFRQQTDIDVDDSGRIHVTWWQSGEMLGTVCHAGSG